MRRVGAEPDLLIALLSQIRDYRLANRRSLPRTTAAGTGRPGCTTRALWNRLHAPSLACRRRRGMRLLAFAWGELPRLRRFRHFPEMLMTVREG